MAAPLYDDLMLDHIRNARNYRALPDAQCSAHVSNPLCGDELTVYLSLDDDRIAEIGFQASCCGIAMASASIMTEAVKGMRVMDAMNVLREVTEMLKRPADAAKELSVEQLAVLEAVRNYPARVGCAALAWTALENALAACGRHAPGTPRPA